MEILRFGKWTVLEKHVSTHPYSWNCRCDCGVTKPVLYSNLKSGKTKSCGSCGVRRRSYPELKIKHVILNGQECKRCSSCGVAKTLDDFQKCKDISDGLASSCRLCKNKKTQTFRALNRDHFLKQSRERENKEYALNRDSLSSAQRQKTHDLKRKAVEYLGGKCLDCFLITSVLRIYDFHHRDPTEKDLNVGQCRSFCWNSIVKELDKCDLLCANCHRIRHYKMRFASEELCSLLPSLA